MIHINEQSSKESSFLLNSQANPHFLTTEQPHPTRAPVSQSSTQLEHEKPLLSYLFFSGQTSKVEEKAQHPHDHHQCPYVRHTVERGSGLTCLLKNDPRKQQLQQRLRIVKGKGLIERVKTDVMGEESLLEEVAALRLENERLRGRMLRYEQSAVGLESVQGQLQYYKKVTFLQQSEIQKLRILLRQTQSEKLQLFYSNHYQPQIALKSNHPLQERTPPPKPMASHQTQQSKIVNISKRTRQRAKRSRAGKENSLGGGTLSGLSKGREELRYESRRQSTQKNSIALKSTGKGGTHNHRQPRT